MTVTYVRRVANSTSLTFFRLLFIWRGSVWKCIHRELLVFLCLYSIIMVIDTTVLEPNEAGVIFGIIVKYGAEMIPELFTAATFAMGFYVTNIYSRWWEVYRMMPWQDTVCHELNAHFRDRGAAFAEQDEDQRKTVCRYLCLCYVLVFRDISERIKNRFPTLAHLQGSLLTKREQEELEATKLAERVNWMPIEWIVSLLKGCYRDGRINDYGYSKIIASLMNYRERLHNIMQYDTVNLPLIYTQVVFLVTYIYFGLKLVAIQRGADRNLMWFLYSIPLPLGTCLEFVFLIGWLRSAEVMINPLGSDDDDFDLDQIIERNFFMSFSIVEHSFRRGPKKSDIQQTVELPKRNIESMVEDILRPQHTVAGSAVLMKNPEAQEGQMTFPPTLEGALRQVSLKERLSKKSASRQEAKENSLIWKKVATLQTPTKNFFPTAKNTPNTSQITATSARRGGLTTADDVGNLVAQLEILRKVERKRDEMEVEWTQIEDGEEIPPEIGPKSGQKTPWASKNGPTPEKSKLSKRDSKMQELSTSKKQPTKIEAKTLPPTAAELSKLAPKQANQRNRKRLPKSKTSAEQLQFVVRALRTPEQKSKQQATP